MPYDVRFIRNVNTVLSFLVLFSAIAGAFCHAAGSASEMPEIAISPKSPMPGDVIVVTVKGTSNGMNIVGRFGDDPMAFFPLSEGGFGALAAVDMNDKSNNRMISIEVFESNGVLSTKYEDTLKIARCDYEIQNLNVAHGYVVVSDADQQRANREAALRRQVISSSRSEVMWKGGFSKPLDGRISSTFGARRLFNGQLKSMHNGIDIAAPTGTPILSAAAGRVAMVCDFFYAGKSVYIDHGNGLFTSYLHLSSFAVKQGDMVEKGQKIGYVGATGRVTGPHLHWSAILGGKTINPDRLTELPESFRP